MKKIFCTAILIAMMTIGCSGGSNQATAPDPLPSKITEGNSAHMPWGLWQGTIDPEAQTLEFVQLRSPEFHLNALPFLEPPPQLNLTLDSLQFNSDIIEADIGLRHPFLGLTQFTGFDVCGIFITDGSVTGFTDAGIVMPGEGDTRLLNPDGFARWWNPAEFPSDGTILGYTDGLLGIPDSSADFSGTVNGYKYFCDDLSGTDDPLSLVTQENRGLFSAGQKNVRHYTIKIGAGLVFNYAIDANWQFPNGSPPYAAPDDFAPGANRAEAWRIVVNETENSLWNDGIDNGGTLSLNVDVYDWFDADLNTVRVESPGNFSMIETATPSAGGIGYSTYQLDIVSVTPPETGMEILISVISDEPDFEGFISGVNTTAYFTHTTDVAVESPNVNYDLVIDSPKTFDTVYRDYSPCITPDSNDKIYIMWLNVYYTPPTNTTTDYATSDDTGVSWEEPYWSALGGFVDADDTAPALDADGDVYYFGASHINYGWSMIVRFNPTFDVNDQSGLSLISSQYGRAFGFTHDGYPLAFGDYTTSINYKRGLQPNSPHSQGGWPGGWSSTPSYNAVPEPSRLSKTDNLVRDSSNALYFSYFSSTATDTWIRLAYNSDGTGLNWNYTNDIYDGANDGYDSLHDPGLFLDSGETFHTAFIGHTLSPSESETILYSNSTDGTTWSAPVSVFENSGDGNLNDVTIEKVTYGANEILGLCYLNNDEVYFTYSFDDGATWETPTLVSAGTDGAPDMCSTSDGYLHLVWEHGQDGTDAEGTIEYKRAYFVEQ